MICFYRIWYKELGVFCLSVSGRSVVFFLLYVSPLCTVHTPILLILGQLLSLMISMYVFWSRSDLVISWPATSKYEIFIWKWRETFRLPSFYFSEMSCSMRTSQSIITWARPFNFTTDSFFLQIKSSCTFSAWYLVLLLQIALAVQRL